MTKMYILFNKVDGTYLNWDGRSYCDVLDMKEATEFELLEASRRQEYQNCAPWAYKTWIIIPVGKVDNETLYEKAESHGSTLEQMMAAEILYWRARARKKEKK